MKIQRRDDLPPLSAVEPHPERVEYPSCLQDVLTAEVARTEAGVALQHVPQRCRRRKVELQSDPLDGDTRRGQHGGGEQEQTPREDGAGRWKRAGGAVVDERLTMHAERPCDLL